MNTYVQVGLPAAIYGHLIQKDCLRVNPTQEKKTEPKDSMRENPDDLIWALGQAMIEQV